MLYVLPFIAAAAPTALAVLGAKEFLYQTTDLVRVAWICGIGGLGYVVLVRLTMPDIWDEGIVRLTSTMRLRRRLEV